MPSYPSMIRSAVVTIALLGASAALAAPIPGPKKTEFRFVPLRVTETDWRADPMRRASKSWPVQPGDEAAAEDVVEGRKGRGPWRFFEGTFAEETCRSPEMSSDGTTSMAICTGLDVSRPEDENVVLVVDGELSRYRFPVASLPGSELVRVHLTPDGKRFAVLTEEGGGRSVHLINLESGKDWKIAGGWTEPGNPVVASEADVVAFVARVGRDQAVIVASAQGVEGLVVRRDKSGLKVHGLSPDGTKVLITGDTVDRQQLLLLDLEDSKMQQLSHRKSATTSVAVHPSLDGVAYTADVGGICAMYWADVSERRRVELMSSLDTCWEVLDVDDARRSILYLDKGETERPVKIHDRRRDELRYQVIKGCSDPTLSGDGALMGVVCPKARAGAGAWLFLVPPPKDDD